MYFNVLSSFFLSPPATKNHRSAAAVKGHNQHRPVKLAERQALFYISRMTSPQWTVIHVRKYLVQQQLPFAKLASIRNPKLQIRFNDSHSLQKTDSNLPHNIFSPKPFSSMF